MYERGMHSVTWKPPSPSVIAPLFLTAFPPPPHQSRVSLGEKERGKPSLKRKSLFKEEKWVKSKIRRKKKKKKTTTKQTRSCDGKGEETRNMRMRGKCRLWKRLKHHKDK